MLYDPKWEQKTDTAPLLRFIAWLEKQPRRGTYDFKEPSKCAIAQWLKSEGAAEISLSCGMVDQLLGGVGDFCGKHVSILSVSPYTFGAALKRARKLAAA